MTSLDEISFKLGELSAGQAALLDRQSQSERESREAREILHDIKDKLDGVVEDHKWMKPQVKHYGRVRNIGAWAASAVVGVAGVVGGAITNFVFKKWGGG